MSLESLIKLGVINGVIPLNTTSLDNTTNLNTLNKTSQYYQKNAANALESLNYPVQETGFLQVIELNVVLQKYSTSTGKIYTRGQDLLGAWLPWRKEIVQIQDNVLSDLNNQEPGTIQQTNSSTLNIPSTDTYQSTCIQTGDVLVQDVTGISTGIKYWRTKEGTNAWSAWNEALNTLNVQESIETATQNIEQWTQNNFYRTYSTPLRVDLNTLNSPSHVGNYFQDLSVFATAENNYPITEAGTLCVYLGTSISQEYTTYLTHQKFFRSYYLGAWQPWVQTIYNNNNVILSQLGINGYRRFSDGFELKWGRAGPAIISPIVFNPPFLNVCCIALAISVVPDGKRSTGIVGALSKTGFQIISGEGGVGNQSYEHLWLALGY